MYRSALGSRLVFAVVALAWLAACSGSEPTPPMAEPVASIVIINIPSSPLLSPNGVQLFASALNAAGKPIQRASYSWSSSDLTIATVSADGIVTGVGAGSVTISVFSGDKSASALLDVRVSGVLGPAGGTVSFIGGAVTLSVAAGLLRDDLAFTVRPISDSVATTRIVRGSGYEVLTTPLRPLPLMALELRFDPSRIPAGASEETLELYSLRDGFWHRIPGSTVSTSTHSVSGRPDVGGIFGVANTGVEQVAIGGALLGGALFAGQSGTLSTVLRDLEGYTLSNRTVLWSTSDPAVATVVDGAVTAVGNGLATITATAEGKSDTTSVLVIARPTADWGRATEWTMHQGDAAHTGFVDATIDPFVFAKRWSRPPLPGTARVNPVTFGPGAVFTSSADLYNIEHKAFAVDLGTGATRWIVSFGNISSSDPPSYAAGTVYLTTGGHSDAFLYALDAATGVRRFRSRYDNQFFRFRAPVISGSTVVMAGGFGGGVYAFDASSGTQRWFVPTGAYEQWTPAVGNGIAYAYTGPSDSKVRFVDVATGASLGEIPDAAFDCYTAFTPSAPTLGGSNDLLTTACGRLASFNLQTRALQWHFDGRFAGTVAVAAGVLYVVNGNQLEARRESDGELLWSWKPVVGQTPSDGIGHAKHRLRLLR